MKKTLVLVADSEKARLFEFEHCREPWQETACLVNPETLRDEGARRPPRVHQSVGRARHAMRPHIQAERDRDREQVAVAIPWSGTDASPLCAYSVGDTPRAGRNAIWDKNNVGFWLAACVALSLLFSVVYDALN
jgi:hypothetical protein